MRLSRSNITPADEDDRCMGSQGMNTWDWPIWYLQSPPLD